MTTVLVIGGLVWVVGCVVLVWAVLRMGAIHDDRHDEIPPSRDHRTTSSETRDDSQYPDSGDSRRSA